METTTPRKSRSGGAHKKRRNFSGSSRDNGGNNRRKFSRGNRGKSQRSGNKRKMPTFNPSQFINKNPVELKAEVYSNQYSFADFNLDQALAKQLDIMGIATPSPIQDQSIAHSLEGKDIIGLAETGSGKTAAFLIPLIQRIVEGKAHQALILAPTRELAIQINDEFRKLTKHIRQFSTVCVGGVGIVPQIKSLRRTNHFIIGTPGRVLDLINRGDFDTSGVDAVVLDEADRMLDMGFIHDMRKILSNVPKERQTLFFSATMTKEAKNLVHDFLRAPIQVSVKKTDTAKSIEQDVVMYDEETKFDTLTNLLNQDEFSRVIIFGSMKHRVGKLARMLTEAGIPAESIHGNKTHGQRQRALKNIKEGRVNVLVATDVAARGIHVDDVSHVINYELPQTFEDYVHRIGRTGRGTKRGKALTFVPGN